jgi:hypothetical protein
MLRKYGLSHWWQRALARAGYDFDAVAGMRLMDRSL